MVVDANMVNGDRNATALHHAVKEGNVEIAQMLLQSNANVNAQDVDGNTPLHSALFSCNEIGDEARKCIAELLLNKGADSEIANHREETALHLAAENGYVDVVQLLLRFNANINAQDVGGNTALHYALFSYNEIGDESRKCIAELLLNKGADFEIANHREETALHLASENGYVNIVELLLKYNANVNAGKCTPLYRAKTLDLVYVFTSHVVKLIALNSYVCDENIEILHSSPTFNDYRIKCETEIKSMKTKINATNATYFDIFTKDINVLSKYVNNEKIIHLHKCNELYFQIPIYGKIIRDRFCQGIERNNMEVKSTRFLCLFMKVLNHDIVEKIISYLHDSDLRNVISACCTGYKRN